MKLVLSLGLPWKTFLVGRPRKILLRAPLSLFTPHFHWFPVYLATTANYLPFVLTEKALSVSQALGLQSKHGTAHRNDTFYALDAES